MKQLACTDLNPKTTCNFVATGETSREAARVMLDHAQESHAEDLKELGENDDEIFEKMEARAHN